MIKWKLFRIKIAFFAASCEWLGAAALPGWVNYDAVRAQHWERCKSVLSSPFGAASTSDGKSAFVSSKQERNAAFPWFSLPPSQTCRSERERPRWRVMNAPSMNSLSGRAENICIAGIFEQSMQTFMYASGNTSITLLDDRRHNITFAILLNISKWDTLMPDYAFGFIWFSVFAQMENAQL